jgi:hypothetical protein
MKIAIIISGNSSKSPYLSYYSNFLDKQKIEYDIICWNRRLIDEPITIAYNVSQDEDKGYFHRFYSYLGYRRFVINCLNRNNYDKIIISTIAIAILLYPYLKKHYRNKYIFDIRDYSLILNFTWFILKSLIDNSAATVISSKGFTHWLPKSSNYYIAHNFPFELTKGNVELLSKEHFNQNMKPLEITTIGSLRDFEANKLIIDSFKNSNQFKIKFIGTGPAYNPLKKYVLENKVSNASFYGYYQKKDEADLLKKSDIINNFTNIDLNSRTLMTNRFYLSAVLGIPMLVRFGTYQAEICQRYNLGCIVKTEIDIKLQLKEFLKTFNENDFINGCKRFLKKVENDTMKLDFFLLDFTSKL